MLTLEAPHKPVAASVKLSGSKSISNRWLLLNHLFNAGLQFQNLSDAEDTQLLQTALNQIKAGNPATLHVNHAGSNMRFLTALLALTPGSWTLTGSERLKQRPIHTLVQALDLLGADISYLEKTNHLPLRINGKQLDGGEVDIAADISSQFVSAMLLVSAAFKNGLTLRLKGDRVSEAYVQMTLAILKQAGIKVKQNAAGWQIAGGQSIAIKTGEEIQVESDWSSASYWYSFCALSKGSVIRLNGLQQTSLQPDSVLPHIYSQLGVESQFSGNHLLLSHKQTQKQSFDYNFTNCPDIAQTLAVTCFGLGMEARLTGLKTLTLKESDRITALKTELGKFGAKVDASEDSLIIHKSVNTQVPALHTVVNTYNDHRMAMSFAPLALIYHQISFNDGTVVSKSYPGFWHDLKNAGFSVNLQP